MNSMIGKHIKIVEDFGLPAQDQVGRVVDQDGPVVYVTNQNMPYQGTLVRKPFTINEVEVVK